VTVPVDRAEAEIKGNLIYMTVITTIGTIFLVTFVALAMNISIKKIDKDKQ
jgi:hypothetical protein